MADARLEIHLDLDAAWPAAALGLPRLDASAWGSRLRYLTSRRTIDAFDAEVAAGLPPFVLYGSGDFHHLAAVFLRRRLAALGTTPVTVVSFDNHPDCDVRPPRWACGAWVSRAVEMPGVSRVAVWGCGNWELDWPGYAFANRRAIRAGRVEIFPWAERMTAGTARRFECVARSDWRERFTAFAMKAGGSVYVTVDLDCLTNEEAATDWEQGLFTADDVAWAVTTLRRHNAIVGGDVCGATSPGRFATRFQRLAAWWDHPRVPAIDLVVGRERNLKSLATIWPALTV